MANVGGGGAHPFDPTDNGQIEEGFIRLDPDYPGLLRWFIHALTTDSFEGAVGRRKALGSVIDITRYLAYKDPQELQAIMHEVNSDG